MLSTRRRVNPTPEQLDLLRKRDELDVRVAVLCRGIGDHIQQGIDSLGELDIIMRIIQDDLRPAVAAAGQASEAFHDSYSPTRRKKTEAIQ